MSSSAARKDPANDWVQLRLADVAVFRGGNGFPERYQGASAGLYPFIKVAELSEAGNEREIQVSRNWLSEKLFDQLRPTLHPPGAVVFAKVGAALKLNRRRVLVRPTAIDNNMMSVEAGERLAPAFLFALMQTLDMAAFCQDGGLPSVNQTNLGQFEFSLPPLPEQRRIAAILDEWDNAIATAEKLAEAKLVRKDGLAHKLLDLCLVDHPPQGWVTAHLGDLFEERTAVGGSERLLAVTAGQGIIDRDATGRKDTSADDKSNYKLIEPGDIGYNTMRMWQGVSALSSLRGLVSPAYTIVRPNADVDAQFAAQLFKYHHMIHTFWRYSQGLVDDTLMLKFPQFSEIKINIPPLDVQKEAGEILRCADLEVGQSQDLSNQLRLQKRGLMQKLLSGDWPVPASIDRLLPGGQEVDEAVGAEVQRAEVAG